MPEYKTPGVYVEEIPASPRSIQGVETSIPAFIGATQKAEKTTTADLFRVPVSISSMIEYERYFGFAKPETGVTITIDTTMAAAPIAKASIQNKVPYLMYNSVRHFFANGGSNCYIISIGDYSRPVEQADLLAGLNKAAETPGITMMLFPDAMWLPAAAYYNVCKEALQQCAEKNNRIALIDVWRSDAGQYAIDELRSYDLGNTHQLSFGAAYYPHLISSYNYTYDEASIICSTNTSLNGTLKELKQKDPIAYSVAIQSISELKVLLPASPAVAGIYARVDNNRGVWKAPANEIVNDTVQPEVFIDNKIQDGLNVHVTGRSINSVRHFLGKGVLVWGARTLAGNDNEWRYIPVRRFFIMIEESIRSSTSFVVFEPNDASTWTRVKSMIDNFLISHWRQGALAGSKPEHAFFVKIGLNETMTALDISEGRMIIEIGIAMMRPAEFIILRITHLVSKP
ncbi:MAG: phage tail sheath family protein [Bacteroidetes bacterium]|nr:MAG: phage tail sheath family protein [Bacteroidota bacterium]